MCNHMIYVDYVMFTKFLIPTMYVCVIYCNGILQLNNSTVDLTIVIFTII